MQNTMFIKGNRGGRGYTLLAEESIVLNAGFQGVICNISIDKTTYLFIVNLHPIYTNCFVFRFFFILLVLFFSVGFFIT